MNYEEDEIDASTRRRRQETAMAYSMFLVFGIMAYQEYRMNHGGKAGKRWREVVEHRNRKRSKRRVFGPQGVFKYIQRNHLGPDALFGKEFHLYYRLSRPRIQVILETLGNSGDPYFDTYRQDRYGRVGPSLEAKVLLPLRTLA